MNDSDDARIELAPLGYHTPPKVTSNPLAVCAEVSAAVLVVCFFGRGVAHLRFLDPAVTCLALGVITAALALAALVLARRRRTGAGLAMLCLLVGAAGAAYGATWAARSLKPVRDYAGPAACARQLQEIGRALGRYAVANRGRYPDSFATLVLTQDLDPSYLVCPCTAHTPATGPTTQALLANLAARGHMSYVYAGKGLTYRATADYVLAYEAPVNHGGGKGMNVLFADGHVEMVRGDAADRLFEKLEAGHNPLTAEDWK
jgi:prepilin-type processing-associated H-X9-DG protein